MNPIQYVARLPKRYLDGFRFKHTVIGLLLIVAVGLINFAWITPSFQSTATVWERTCTVGHIDTDGVAHLGCGNETTNQSLSKTILVAALVTGKPIRAKCWKTIKQPSRTTDTACVFTVD